MSGSLWSGSTVAEATVLPAGMVTLVEVLRIQLSAGSLIPADAVVIQADHAEYRTVGAGEIPGVRAVVDGRRISSEAAWGGVPYRVIGTAV